MRHDLPVKDLRLKPRPPREPKTQVTASMTVVEWKRLQAIAEARRVTLSELLRHAIEQTYLHDPTKDG